MTPEVKTSVFVYGTLKPGGHYHEAYCGDFQWDACEGFIKGRLFDFPTLGYPGAMEDPSDSIQGVLLNFYQDEHLVLAKLDRLEGYDPQQPIEQNEYYRRLVVVYNRSHGVISENAWCYFMTPERVKELDGIHLSDGHWPA